jgi:DNA polymerase-3 subunit epsilon
MNANEALAFHRRTVCKPGFKCASLLDTETTGLDPLRGDRLVEIGCGEIINRTPTGQTLHWYINRQPAMPAEAFAVHGPSSEFF